MKQYYDILQLPNNSSKQQIRKQYRKLALIHHPDKGGNEQKFQSIFNAYSKLTNPPEQKISYNKIKPQIITVPITLEDIYMGNTIQYKYSRTLLCKYCDATGHKYKKKPICMVCNGNGVCVSIQHLFAGFSQSIPFMCTECNGSGKKKIPSYNQCLHCNGKSIIQQTESIDIIIPKGVNEQYNMIFHHKGHQLKPNIYRDLHIRFKTQPDSMIIRKKNDLYISHTISCITSLCKSYTYITHLDKRVLRVELNDSIQPNETKVIYNEGMHIMNSELRGNLYVQFKITNPTYLTKLQHASLKRFFKPYLEKEQSFDKEVFLHENNANTVSSDSDSEDIGIGISQCHQQ